MSAAVSPLSGSLEIDLAADLVGVDRLDAEGLRVLWRKRLRGTPPRLPRPLLMRLLAYRLQAQAFGDLDAETAKALDRIAREGARRRQAGEARPKAVPAVAPVPRDRGIKPGTMLMREHGGRVHHVMVVEDGFAWQGRSYASLSEIARLITGTQWSGPPFFGLREGRDRNGVARADLDDLALVSTEQSRRAGDRHPIDAGAPR